MNKIIDFFFYKMIYLSFASPKERNKEKEPTKTNPKLSFFPQANASLHETCGSHFSWTSAAP